MRKLYLATTALGLFLATPIYAQEGQTVRGNTTESATLSPGLTRAHRTLDMLYGWDGTVWRRGLVDTSGRWITTARAQDGAGNALTSSPAGATRPLDIIVRDSAGNAINAFGGTGGTASNFGAGFPAPGTAIGATDGTNMVGVRALNDAATIAGGGAPYNFTTLALGFGWDGTVWRRVSVDTTGRPSTNMAAINGVAVLAGNGVTGTGSARITLASDSTLPTGWPSAANQTAVQGSKAAGTAAVNSTLVGGVFNTALPTLTNGQQAAAQFDSSGRLIVNVGAGGGAGGTSSTFGSALPGTGTAVGVSDGTNMVSPRAFDADTAGGTQQILGVMLRKSASGGSAEHGIAGSPLSVSVDAGTVFNNNGISNNNGSSPVVLSNEQTGHTMHKLVAAASNNATIVKAATAQLKGWQLGNISANIAFLKLYDKATAPTCGGDLTLLRKTIIIPANTSGAGNNHSIPMGAEFTTGLAYCVVSGIAESDNTAVAAATYLINIDYE